MRSYERNGVSVDQCTECRGIFLDRGELERLVDAEAQWNQRGGEPRRDEPRYEQPRYEQPRSEHGYQQQHGHQGHGYQQGYGKPRKKKSFFDELFD